MTKVQKGDFLVVDRGSGIPLDNMYRAIMLTGSTCNADELLKTANGMNRCFNLDAPEIIEITDAVARIEKGGWLVLQFLNS